MRYFDQGFFNFFKSLAVSNNSEWFHANKETFEKNVRKPFEIFVRDMISEIQKTDTAIRLHPKDAILRINKDIRFSKDKSPYNLHATAFISVAGKRDKTMPGIFLRFAPEGLGIMGGCYCPSKQQLQKIRAFISENTERCFRLTRGKNFVDKFGHIKGEVMKRYPAALKRIADKEPLVLNKQWYFVAEREAELLFSANLLEEILEYYHAGKKINDFLIEAMK